MINRKLKINARIIILITVAGLSGCSALNKIGKSAKNLTTFGNKNIAGVDNTLIIPPSLKVPVNNSAKQISRQTATKSSAANSRKTVYTSNKNYYIVIGTYPDQNQALDTFVRLSSIGLKGATMESRQTKSGNNLHMVRLGPYSNQEDIDKAKDSLTNDGLSQFKVVEN